MGMMVQRSSPNGVMWECAVCLKVMKRKSMMVEHVEAFHVQGFTHACSVCFKTFKSRASLRSHFHHLHK